MKHIKPGAYSLWLGLLAAMTAGAADSSPASMAGVPYPDALARSSIALTTLNDPINDALILGNGDLNALLFVDGEDLVLRITKNDVWDARLDTTLDAPLPSFKRLLELGQGVWTERNYILPEGSTWKGPDSYHAHAYPCPRACAVVRVKGAAKPPLTAGLGLQRAEAEIHTETGAVRVFISADANALVIERHPLTEEESAFRIGLEPIHSNDIPMPETGGAESAQWVAQDIPGDRDWPGMRFAVASASNNTDRVVIAVVTSREAGDPLHAAQRLAEGQLARLPRQVTEAHRAAWEAFWSRSGVSLGDETLERVWYRNLYFLRCVSKPGVVSTGLFAGLLNDTPAWHGDYHTNYNIQQTYWAAYAANQCGLAEPYDQLVTDYLPRARWLARQVFDMRGAYFPHVLFAYEPPHPEKCKMPGGRQYIHHVWGMTLGVNGFSVQPLWWRYKYEPSREYLKNVAYPAVRDVADFQADFVGRCKRNGDVVVLGPSVSPEHWGWTPQFERNRNCAFDIAMFQFIFSAAIEGATTLGVDAGRVARWRKAEALLPPYPVAAGDSPVVVDVEGAPPIEYNIPVPTTPVFPGDQVTCRSPEEERALFTRTLARLRHNGNNAPIMLAVARARLDTPDAYDFLRTELDRRERRNGTLSFNRLDSNNDFNTFGHYTEMFGAALPISELLVQSVGGVVRVFPNWPNRLPAWFTTLRTEGGFLISAEQAGGKVGPVQIESTAGGTLCLASPWPEAQITRAGAAAEALRPGDDGLLSVKTRPCETFTLTPGL